MLGLVVARLSEDYIVEATGSLPQNVNYALTESELAGVPRRSRRRGGTGGLRVQRVDFTPHPLGIM